jgi:thiol-disulfide isomerase/thioredoxin
MLLALVFVVGLSAPASTQGSLPRIGGPAPAFAFAGVVTAGDATPGAPQAYSAESLKGKVVVLNFFATTCRPCVEAIPHVNELVEATRDLPVVFLAVANQPEPDLRRLLESQPMRSTLVLDLAGQTYQNYFIRQLPFVVVVDRAGRISSFEHPARLSRAAVERAMR